MVPMVDDKSESVATATSIAYICILGTVLIMSFFIMCLKINSWGQKTRSTQQRRMYTGSRTRQLSTQGEPTIFVSPNNLPPPPKYEAMAPPSYEEVMGIQYSGFHSGQQPITHPIAHAMAQGSSSDIPSVHTANTNISSARSTEIVPSAPATVTITNEDRRTSVTSRA